MACFVSPNVGSGGGTVSDLGTAHSSPNLRSGEEYTVLQDCFVIAYCNVTTGGTTNTYMSITVNDVLFYQRNYNPYPTGGVNLTESFPIGFVKEGTKIKITALNTMPSGGGTRVLYMYY